MSNIYTRLKLFSVDRDSHTTMSAEGMFNITKIGKSLRIEYSTIQRGRYEILQVDVTWKSHK